MGSSQFVRMIREWRIVVIRRAAVTLLSEMSTRRLEEVIP
jgi:hypothetical protein